MQSRKLTMFDIAYKKMSKKYRVMKNKKFHTGLTGEDVINHASLVMLKTFGTDGADSLEHYINLFNKHIYYQYKNFRIRAHIPKWSSASTCELFEDAYWTNGELGIDSELNKLVNKHCPILNYRIQGYTQMEIADKIKLSQTSVRKIIMKEQTFLRDYYGYSKV